MSVSNKSSTITTLSCTAHFTMSTHHHMRLEEAQLSSLLDRVDNEIASARGELQHAQPIAEAAGLS
eukprot:scaffold16875_cov168-Skeletonema_marinoi.AAC.1